MQCELFSTLEGNYNDYTFRDTVVLRMLVNINAWRQKEMKKS